MNTKNNPDRFDCLHMAKGDEPLFTLLARDPDAPAAVEAWAVSREARIAAGKKPQADFSKVDNARNIISEMHSWHERNPGEEELGFANRENPILPYLSPSIPVEAQLLASAVRRLVSACYGAATASGWHTDLKTKQRKEHNIGERLMLIVSEIAEGMEGHRKSLMDDKLPNRPMLEVELADAAIRIFDLAGYLGLDMAGALVEKMAFNAVRPDHKIAARQEENGKAY